MILLRLAQYWKAPLPTEVTHAGMTVCDDGERRKEVRWKRWVRNDVEEEGKEEKV